nr:uncharacterized protein LOC122598864 isoform X2 [Erigeron canadensis]
MKSGHGYSKTEVECGGRSCLSFSRIKSADPEININVKDEREVREIYYEGKTRLVGATKPAVDARVDDRVKIVPTEDVVPAQNVPTYGVPAYD